VIRTASITILLAVCVIIAAGCASVGKLATEQAGYPEAQVDARGLFVENCARCHGQDGHAKTFHGRLLGAQNLADPFWRALVWPDDIVHAIRTGPGLMPAFGNKLSPAEIAALASYVQTIPPSPE